MTRPLNRATALLIMLGLPVVASAHVGVDAAAHHGLTAGLAHPFTGADHLLAMLAVGIWGALTAARVEMRTYLRAPLAFAALLLVGALAAANGLALPAVETMIAASLLGLGLMIVLRLRLPAAIGVAAVGAFALFHGAAHGQELGGGAALLGMVLGTVVLHAIGLVLGHLLRDRSAWWPRAAGLTAIATGAAALLG